MKIVSDSKKKTLGEELFDKVEAAQGYSYISDGIDGAEDAEVMDIAKRSLKYHRECIRLLERFLKKYTRAAKDGGAL